METEGYDPSQMLLGDMMQGHEDMETVGLLGEGLDDGTGLLAGDEQVLAGDANEDLENWCLHDDRPAAGGGSASASRGGRRGQGATPPHL
jgi:hypothetical protein